MVKGFACPVCGQVSWGEGIKNCASPYVSCDCCGWSGTVDDLRPVMIIQQTTMAAGILWSWDNSGASCSPTKYIGDSMYY